ncbi:MAG: hemin uptake protein HemP [Dokdonella sp.]|uniref:hemin uptake protein HemP n=1 Tax=Dokdonella sp. TaxID=2291710 RepID=UPI0025BD2548|nr:hemin uptake protein HemP [Dokdonella sp.]MBX3702048.1 hemin uptake protein HemP [Dokdonella sp.]MCW5577041.1 hemin uptake protein HemP [Dokdonella sp.]
MFDSIASPSVAESTACPLDPVAPGRAPRIGSGQLLAGARELVIEHAGQEYHLRLTRNDRLILTK